MYRRTTNLGHSTRAGDDSSSTTRKEAQAPTQPIAPTDNAGDGNDDERLARWLARIEGMGAEYREDLIKAMQAGCYESTARALIARHKGETVILRSTEELTKLDGAIPLGTWPVTGAAFFFLGRLHRTDSPEQAASDLLLSGLPIDGWACGLLAMILKEHFPQSGHQRKAQDRQERLENFRKYKELFKAAGMSAGEAEEQAESLVGKSAEAIRKENAYARKGRKK